MNLSETGNVFEGVSGKLPEEMFRTLAESGPVRIEQIVSCGHATPSGTWYDQGWHEWVLLLSGGAGVRFEGEQEELTLAPGDYVMIPAGRRHRVEWTLEGQETVWLAVHIKK